MHTHVYYLAQKVMGNVMVHLELRIIFFKQYIYNM